MTSFLKRLSGCLVFAIAGLLAGMAGSTGTAVAVQPQPWQATFQPANTELMADIEWFNNFTLVIATLIVILVLGLLLYCMIRFNARSNPVPSKTTHNSLIEVIWTVVPIITLIIIAVPSFRLLYKQVELPEAEVTIKATGNQWYWGYEYKDVEDVSFDALMLTDDDRAAAIAAGTKPEDIPRLLATDNAVVIPVGKVVWMEVTAEAVIHAWTIPAFGVKIDALPGRLNTTWFKAEKTGVYYGQCSELCGKDHAFMPITVRVVTEDQYAAWLEAAQSDMEEANKLLMSMIKSDQSAKKLAAR